MEKTLIFIPVTAILLLSAIIVVGVRFGVHKQFTVALDVLCVTNDDQCVVATCDEIYSGMFGCTIGEDIEIQEAYVDGSRFTKCLDKKDCQW